MAQLVAHLLCKQRVAGSNPASSTDKSSKKSTWVSFYGIFKRNITIFLAYRELDNFPQSSLDTLDLNQTMSKLCIELDKSATMPSKTSSKVLPQLNASQIRQLLGTFPAQQSENAAGCFPYIFLELSKQ